MRPMSFRSDGCSMPSDRPPARCRQSDQQRIGPIRQRPQNGEPNPACSVARAADVVWSRLIRPNALWRAPPPASAAPAALSARFLVNRQQSISVILPDLSTVPGRVAIAPPNAFSLASLPRAVLSSNTQWMTVRWLRPKFPIALL